ncbi:MAG: DUF3990 domain-containing protein [Spirochaetaceae bacterium]|jgi:hypothetical protein|nr:DUF3990 domain-containing protein [Spirochaetaceae bacterium]
MILYHGSNTEIESIELSKCRPNKDFGRGFYLTSMKDQVESMAARTARIYGGSPCVTIFSFDEHLLAESSLNIKKFPTPSEDWASFVINNRNRNFRNITSPECNSDNKYDIVYGPVANDDLALLFRQLVSGLISVEALVKQMEYKTLTDQYSFHTPEAVKYLVKKGAIHE